jgi:two-component system, OmpR family, sensor kinase ParS
MIRIFVKMYGWVIVTMVALFYIQGEVADYFRQQAGAVNMRARFQGTFNLVELDLLALPRENWSARLKELGKGFATPVHLLTLDELKQRFDKQGPTSAAMLMEGKVLSYDRAGGGFYLYRRIADSDAALVLEFPGPRDVRTQLLTVNWIIQLAAFALILGFWIYPFWRDMMTLNRAAQAIGDGRFDTPIGLKRSSALSRLGTAFETMKGRIAQLITSHKELTSAVSHELRNPIMRLHYRHALAREAATMDEKDRNLDLMRDDLAELDRLAEEMLTYAKLERAEPNVRLESVHAASWLADLEREASDLARAQERDVKLEFKLDVETLQVEPRYMRRAVSNLLSNAIRYAKGKVLVTVAREGGRSVIGVEDDGQGIAEELRAKIFEPFIRLDESRDRKTGGFGIGLALVRRIAQWHGGEASVESSALGGARFCITW